MLAVHGEDARAQGESTSAGTTPALRSSASTSTTIARAEELIKTVELPWSEVFVPDDERTRGLWADGPGITTLPRLFLIDRAGILRWAGGPGELEARVNSLLE